MGEFFGFADFDVIRDVLAGGYIGEALVHFADDVEDDADVDGFVELGEDDFVDADFAEAGDGVFDAFLRRGCGEDQVNFVRLDEYTKSLQPRGLESGSISTLDDGDFRLCCKRRNGTCCAPFV